MTSGLLLAAAILLLVTGLVHSVLGELLILRHLAQLREVPPLLGSVELTKRTLRFTWHLPTLLASGIALILARYAYSAPLGEGERFAVQVISGALLACAVVTFAVSRGKHPGWVAFLAAAALCWMGAR
jgi:hypothetical protein